MSTPKDEALQMIKKLELSKKRIERANMIRDLYLSITDDLKNWAYIDDKFMHIIKSDGGYYINGELYSAEPKEPCGCEKQGVEIKYPEKKTAFRLEANYKDVNGYVREKERCEGYNQAIEEMKRLNSPQEGKE
jgi:hypothetical protein